MTPPFITPAEQVRRSVAATLRAFDWIGAGLAARPTIRHARRRFSEPTEFPCITIRWEQDEPRVTDQDQQYLNAWEMAVEQRLTLEIETHPSETDDVDQDELVDDDDETGLGFSDALAMLALRALKDPDGDLLSLWASSVSDRGRGEDPDSTPNEARLEQSVIVLYRVSTEDPSVLLAVGMNA